MYVKPTDTDQYLHASAPHVSHCKKSIPFSQALTEFFPESSFFDKRCNELDAWLKERGYSDKLLTGQILKARKFSRSEVSNKRKSVGNSSRFFLIKHIIQCFRNLKMYYLKYTYK